MNWEICGNKISTIFNKYHSKKIKLTEKERLIGIKKEFSNLLIELKTTEKNNAKKYIEKRKKTDIKLNKIQTVVKKNIESFIKDSTVIPASSFSAGTNLIGESDIDFNITIDNLDNEKLIEISNICGENNFKFIEIRSKHDEGLHYVFQKFINNVEIELKIRSNKNYYMKVHNKMHNYLDNIMSNEDKAIITWIKNNLKKTSKKYYSDFKALYYEYALVNAKVYKLLYPLV